MSDEMLSARAALEKAFAGEPAEEVADAPVADTDPVEAPEPQPVDASEQGGRERDEFGRFKAKESAEPEPVSTPSTVSTPPAPDIPDISGELNDPAVRALFAAADPSLRAAIAQRFTEMKNGISEHQERWQALRQYDDMARQGGTTLAAALQNYTGIEQALRQNPLQGLDLICRNFGSDLRTVAAQVMGQPAPDQNAELMQLRQQAQAMARELQGFHAQREQQTLKQISDFGAEHPRFDELSGDIAWLLKTGGATDLETAYRKAERLNPLPEATARTSAPAPVTAEPRKPAGPLSIKGAPSAGSNPARASESLSIRESVKRAMAAR